MKASSMFLGQMSDGMVWRKKNEEVKHTNLQQMVKHGGGSVMVWGCILSFGVGDFSKKAVHPY